MSTNFEVNININNITGFELKDIYNYGKSKICSCKKINDENYNLTFTSYKNVTYSQTIIPGILDYVYDELVYYKSISGILTDLDIDIFDDFLKEYIKDNNLFNPQITFSCHLIDLSHSNIIKTKIENFNQWINSFYNIIDSLSVILSIINFYSDLKSKYTISDKTSYLFKKMLKNQWSLYELIEMSKKNEIKIGSFDYMNDFYTFEFDNQTVFRTYNYKKYQNHKGLSFLIALGGLETSV